MLQQGPLLCFLEEDQLQRILSCRADLTEFEKQFQEGFNVLGFIDLVAVMPVMVFLLRNTASKQITYPMLMTLLTTRFSETGTSSRAVEELTYGYFVSYLKEVAAGRRNQVALGSVLQFVTGSEVEPVLGFKNSPAIVFRDDMPWNVPTANTCICQLTLPSSRSIEKKQAYENFYLAFTNALFGYELM